MSDLFTTLVDRHLGTCDVVKPRSRSRFETESVDSNEPLRTHQSHPDDTREETTIPELHVVHSPEHHPADPPVDPSETRQIEGQANQPDAQPPQANKVFENHGSRKPLINPSTEVSLSADMHPPGIEPRIDDPASQRLEPTSSDPAPAGQINQLEGPSIQTFEQRHDLDGELDNQISAMFARIQDQRTAEISTRLKNPDITRPDDSREVMVDDAPFGPPARHRPMAESVSGLGQTDHPIDGLPTQQEFVSEAQEKSRETALTPPTWFSEVQARLMQPTTQEQGYSQPEPVINVTIGRIEVKATKPREKQHPRKRKKPSGVMSLEKYLRQSGRGGRR